jgi:hypothetical protein
VTYLEAVFFLSFSLPWKNENREGATLATLAASPISHSQHNFSCGCLIALTGDNKFNCSKNKLRYLSVIKKLGEKNVIEKFCINWNVWNEFVRKQMLAKYSQTCERRPPLGPRKTGCF